MTRKHCVLGPVALAVLILVGTCLAGIQEHATVCWLGTGNWQLREIDGQAYLVESRYSVSIDPCNGQFSDDNRHKWHVSAPTIKTRSGKFLGSDPEGHTSSVRLFTRKGANTRWAFVIVDKIVPRRQEGEDYLDGPSGFRFRVKMDEGRFKNWYLAGEKLPAEPKDRGQGDSPVMRPLKLVRDVREATIFTYIDEHYAVFHQ